jgi:MFS family permease
VSDPRPAPLRWWTLAVAALAQFMVLLDVTVVNVALPRLQRDLHAGVGALAWVLDAYTLTFGGLLLLGGRAADLLGRRRVFLAGVLVFTLASLACGLSRSSGVLIAARALQGVGAAIVSPSALSIVTTTFHERRERYLAFAIWGGLGGLGATVGVVAGGLVVDLFGWHWAFLINLPIGAMTLLGALRLIAPAGPVLRGPADVAGAITVTAGLLLLVYAVIAVRTRGWTAPDTLLCAAAGVGALVAFGFLERRSAAPLLSAGTLRTPGLLAGSTGQFLVGATQLAAMYLISRQAQVTLGMRPLTAGLAFLPMGVIAVVAAVGTSGAARRFGVRRTYTGGVLCGLVALAGFAALYRFPGYAAAMLGPALLLGVSLAVTSIAGTLAGTAHVGTGDAGVASGILNATFEVGSAFGLAIAATVAIAGLPAGYLATAVFAALGLVNAAVGYRRRPAPVASRQGVRPP